MDDMETPTVGTPIAAPGEPQFAELRQVTVKLDEEIAAVNQLITEGWRLIGVQSRADATVYVLGKIEKKSKRGTGFLS